MKFEKLKYTKSESKKIIIIIIITVAAINKLLSKRKIVSLMILRNTLSRNRTRKKCFSRP